jgi:hypothetical protein
MLIRRAALDRDEAVAGRGRIRLLRRSNAHIVAFDAKPPVQLGVSDVRPAFNIGVPVVGCLSQIRRHAGFCGLLSHLGCSQQRRDFRREREWRIAGVHLPSLLRCYWAVTH